MVFFCLLPSRITALIICYPQLSAGCAFLVPNLHLRQNPAVQNHISLYLVSWKPLPRQQRHNASWRKELSSGADLSWGKGEVSHCPWPPHCPQRLAKPLATARSPLSPWPHQDPTTQWLCLWGCWLRPGCLQLQACIPLGTKLSPGDS